MIAMYYVYERQHTRVGNLHVSEPRQLHIVALTGTVTNTFFCIIGNEKRATLTYVPVNLAQEDVDASQIQITEMQVMVGYSLKPAHQVVRLWIAGNKKHTPACKEILLP